MSSHYTGLFLPLYFISFVNLCVLLKLVPNFGGVDVDYQTI